ncbi:type 2 periplasmic-binding domain-containing protein [Balneatrix alpica]|uniref:Solute-binding protein family 3/N-terminal domain-containing protein n=1 Tax=Balneatrix alpica TaxID=75684 RepID=A0ABV5ZAQ0_9GAMM|nr:hypothetical protein [Balneatrix alpica]
MRPLLMLCSLFFSVNAIAALRIAIPPAFDTRHPVRSLVERAYAMLNIDIEVIVLPPRRSIWEVNNGNIDAEMARVEEVGNNYPELIKVPEPLGPLKIAVLSLNPDLAVSRWEDLYGLKVDCIRGFLYSELRLGARAEYLSHPDLALERLRIGRSQVAVLPYEYALQLQQRSSFPRLHLLIIDQPTLYHYLHPRHQALVEPLSAAIRQLKQQAAQPAGIEESSAGSPAILLTP